MVSCLGPCLPAASLCFQSSEPWLSSTPLPGSAAMRITALAGQDNLMQFNALHCGPPTDIIRAGASGKPGSAGERHIGYDITGRNSDICETPIS